VRIEAGSGLSEAEVKRMIKDAEEHAAEDRKRREDVESRNHADGIAYRAERLLQNDKAQLTADARTGVQKGNDTLRQALAGTDRTAWAQAARALESKLDALSRESGSGVRHDESHTSEPAEGGPVAADYEVLEDA